MFMDLWEITLSKGQSSDLLKTLKTFGFLSRNISGNGCIWTAECVVTGVRAFFFAITCKEEEMCDAPLCSDGRYIHTHINTLNTLHIYIHDIYYIHTNITYKHTYITYIYIYTHYMHTYIYTHKRTYIHIHNTYITLHTYIIYMHTYIHTYIHT